VNLARRLLALVGVGLLTLSAAAAVGAGTNTTNLVVIGTALVAGYVFELKPDERSPLPVAFAAILVLLRAASPAEFVAIACIAPAVAVVLRTGPNAIANRILLLSEYLAEGLGAGAAFQLIMRIGLSSDPRLVVFGALAGAAVAELVVADVVAFYREGRVAHLRNRGADLALTTSGMLMAIGYGGIGGQGRLGLWGPILFSIPLLAAWYSYELLVRTRRTFQQTVQALGVAPELGGLARPGHVERVARLSVAIGQELSVSVANLRDLETASWLHHLGAVSLEEPEEGHQLNLSDVASAGAEMLRSSNALADAGDIVAAEPALHRASNPQPDSPAVLMGQILKVASAYDELTEGEDAHASWAVEALFTGPGYVYDGNVLAALESVLRGRGLLT
jgi:hypothetical protein